MTLFRSDRINCLNGLIILEHDLTLLFKEALLATSIYGKSDVEVYRQRTDLTPFTIAIQWESLKPNCTVNEVPQFGLYLLRPLNICQIFRFVAN
jgi:hypothetical protein